MYPDIRSSTPHLLLSTIGWMLSRGARKPRPPFTFPASFASPWEPFFLLALNFFQLRALINIECFFRFFSSALFSTRR